VFRGAVMKKLATAIAAIALIGTPAFAADMARKMPVKAPPPAPPPIMSWTGFYIGANAGGGWATTDWQHNHIAECPGNSFAFNVASCDIGNQRSNSFIGGGQIGARWQTGQWVVGIEGSADYANFNANTLDPQAIAAGLTIFDGTRLRNLYTVTGQVGWA
jgi:outer membrane immunogenic protein